MSEWKEYRLDELADVFNYMRIPLSSGERSKRKGIFPYYGASGIIDYVDGYIFDGEFVLISEDGENLKSRQTPIAFKAVGKFWVNNHAHIVKGKDDYLNNLLIWFFADTDLSPYITGAVQPKLSKENLLSIPISLPESKEERVAIASVLSSLDNKIDLLHRQNKTLEQLAETLFRQWFVEEAKVSWEESSLFDAVEILGGGTPKTEVAEYWNGEIDWISGRDITPNHKQFIISTEKRITKEGLENSSTRVLPKFSTVISTRGTVGKTCILASPMAFSQTNYGIVPRYKDCYFFTYLLIEYSIEELQSASYGTVFDTITTNTFKEHKINIPSEVEIKVFEEKVRSYFEKMLLNINQIRTLTRLRDTLLPKLMSGEVRVKI